eukprot:TRINITY_DN8596_c1_g1_i1.p4 TRINITY_DN8596_c1_g1~~TRINITY_DN8596_c1_g1_i1.p4  ORF type:complete len:127 (-),score=33.64 TRINITY_DN8596_c1_g1_i1:317-697(-)
MEMEQQWVECATLVLNLVGNLGGEFNDDVTSCCITLASAAKNFGWWRSFLQKVYKKIFDGSVAVQVQCLQILQGSIEVLGEVLEAYIQENIAQLLQIQENADEEVADLCGKILVELEAKSKDSMVS